MASLLSASSFTGSRAPLTRRPAACRPTATRAAALVTRALLDKVLFGWGDRAGKDGAGGSGSAPKPPRGGKLNRNSDYLVLGGGVAAGYIAKALTEKGFAKDRLCIVSAEDVCPYERPALSKSYLAKSNPARLPAFHTCVGTGGEAQTPEWYASKGIEVLLNSRVRTIDFAKKWAICDDGSYLSYRKLFIATGAAPMRLKVEGADLPNVFYLRSMRDADALAAAYARGGPVVVIGGGYLGLEMAAAAVAHGLMTTLVCREEHILSRLLPPKLSTLYEKLFAAQGVQFVKNAEVIGLAGSAEAGVSAVRLSNGTELPAAAVAVGVGARPCTAAFTGTGLDLAPEAVGGGVAVSGRLRCTVNGVLDPDVWAVGDVAAFPLPARGNVLARVEHVNAARAMAVHAVKSMLDPAGTPNLDYVPHVYMRAFEGSTRPILWQLHGLAEGDAAGAECVLVGDFAPKGLACWLRGGRLLGLLLESGSPEENALLPKLAAARPEVGAAALAAVGGPDKALLMLVDRLG